MKYVIGWLKLRPGTRDQLMNRIKPFVALSLTEQGVRHFEVNTSASDPDKVVFIESYDRGELHRAHQDTPEHQALLADIFKVAVSGKFEHIYPASTRTDSF